MMMSFTAQKTYEFYHEIIVRSELTFVNIPFFVKYNIIHFK